MSSLLKSGHTAGHDAILRPVRTLSSKEALEARLPDVRPVADPQLAFLESQISELTSELVRLQTEREASIAAAYEEGRSSALAALEHDEAAALDLLKGRLETACEAFEVSLVGAQRLAVALAQAAVSKILGAMPESRAAVEAILRMQLARLRPETVIAVTVSAADFSDADALDKLRTALAVPHLVIERDARMARGDCQIALRLGQIEAGLETQRNNLVSFCEALAAEPGAPG